MKDWLDTLKACRDSNNTSCVLVTIVETQGSAPRASGTKMLVNADDFAGTIGGGNLEYQATQMAREIIAQGGTTRLEHFKLGPALGQCCGGATTLLFEPFLSNDFTIFLFGAGHVGQALVNVLAPLPCRLTWLDSRESLFPENLPSHVQVEISETLEDDAADAPAGTFFLVMTHSHDQDFRLCEKILARDDFSYCGLIGSASKRRQFEKRMQRKGMEPERLARLTSPIGIRGIDGKQPAVIAVAIAAEILQLRDQIINTEPVETVS